MDKKTLTFLSISLLAVCLVFPLGEKEGFRDLHGPFMGQTAPVKKAGLFLDGLISTPDGAEMNAAFTLDGKEFYYCALYRGEWSIFMTRDSGKGWTKPVPLPFTAGYTDRDFTMSPDGNRIYFGSNRPRKQGGPVQKRLDIFVTERLATGQWSVPAALGPPVNSDYGENYPCAAANGNLYFFSCRPDGMGGCDLYMSKQVKGRYEIPVLLPAAVNSEKHDWDAFIAPDESYIIFSSQDRADSVGGQDLYISFKRPGGAWTQAKNMGPAVNSAYAEICPVVSPDGKYFFFTSRRRGKADIFWMTTGIIETLKQ
jgi:Tol biopolymer transport system component